MVAHAFMLHSVYGGITVRNFFVVPLIVVCIFVPLVGGPCFGWELEMEGSMNWTYEYYRQTGHNGFFGPYNVDRGFGNAANLNFWNGGQFDTNMTTSAAAGWSYFNVELDPTIKINEAIRIRGKYRLGTYGQPAASDYHTQDAPGTRNAFSEGQWTMFWATALTPWGSFGVGKRPGEFGTALQYDGADAATTESMVLVAPFGPFEIGLAFYPFRYAGSSSVRFFTSQRIGVVGEGTTYGDPYDLEGFEYFSRADQSGTFSKDFLAFLVYSSGPTKIGFLGAYGAYHIGPEARLPDALTGLIERRTLDSDLFHGTAFVKYNNGRFFFNAEAAWLYWHDVYSDPTGQLTSPWNRRIEQWRYMVETGVMVGPARVTVLNAWSPGPDRRNRQMFDVQSAAFVWHPTFDTHLGNFSVFRPYSYLFSYNYGSGLNAYNLSGDGYIRDAFVLAGRFDYSVASNLNIYGSIMYANRTSHGYSWGCIGPHLNGGAFADVNGVDGNISIEINRYPFSPNIPDTALGYEINTGLDWQLLDGWTMSVVFGYWQPGKWFSYACIDRSVPDWPNGAVSNNFGTRPGRTIDPVFGGEFSLSFSF